MIPLKNPLAELEACLLELNRTQLGRRAFLASLPLLLAACASGPKHRSREGDNTGQAAALTVEEEKRMTQQVLPQMQKDYPALNNPDLQNYVSALGKKVVQANALEGAPYNYTFSVVGVNYVNAFALPAGTVMVTAPLIEMADSEAELAGVIGHEVGHIKARHTAERMHEAKKAQSKTWVYAAGGGVVGGAIGFGLGKLFCPPKDTACLTKAAGLGAAAGAGGGLLIQRYAFMANSREDEMEADRIGFRTAVNAGYSKDHVGNFYSKLLRMEQERKGSGSPILGSLQDALSTHPPSAERVKQMNEMMASEPARRSAQVSSRDFDRMRELARGWMRSQGKA